MTRRLRPYWKRRKGSVRLVRLDYVAIVVAMASLGIACLQVSQSIAIARSQTEPILRLIQHDYVNRVAIVIENNGLGSARLISMVATKDGKRFDDLVDLVDYSVANSVTWEDYWKWGWNSVIPNGGERVLLSIQRETAAGIKDADGPVLSDFGRVKCALDGARIEVEYRGLLDTLPFWFSTDVRRVERTFSYTCKGSSRGTVAR